MKDYLIGVGLIFSSITTVLLLAGTTRYPVGQPVASSVYTEPFDPCDLAYKFFQIRYGDPNNPKWQAAPDDWVRMFGNNERTMLLQTVSELRVVVAAQGKRLMALEDWQKKQICPDPNEVLTNSGVVIPMNTATTNEYRKDLNLSHRDEAKR